MKETKTQPYLLPEHQMAYARTALRRSATISRPSAQLDQVVHTVLASIRRGIHGMPRMTVLQGRLQLRPFAIVVLFNLQPGPGSRLLQPLGQQLPWRQGRQILRNMDTGLIQFQ
jgi:hypothetical protein